MLTVVVSLAGGPGSAPRENGSVFSHRLNSGFVFAIAAKMLVTSVRNIQKLVTYSYARNGKIRVEYSYKYCHY